MVFWGGGRDEWGNSEVSEGQKRDLGPLSDGSQFEDRNTLAIQCPHGCRGTPHSSKPGPQRAGGGGRVAKVFRSRREKSKQWGLTHSSQQKTQPLGWTGVAHRRIGVASQTRGVSAPMSRRRLVGRSLRGRQYRVTTDVPRSRLPPDCQSNGCCPCRGRARVWYLFIPLSLRRKRKGESSHSRAPTTGSGFKS